MKKLRKFWKKPLDEKIVFIVYFIFFVVMACVFLYPILYCLLSTFKSTAEFYDETTSLISLPKNPQFETWKNIFTLFQYGNNNFGTMLWNSLWFTAVKVFCTVACSAMLAYAVAKFEFPGKKLIYATAVIVQTIPIFGSGATAYKIFSALGMVNNPKLMWLAWCTGFNMSFIILHGMFKGISNSYAESAKIDGASNLTILLKIILPLAAPTIVALMVTNSVTVWNDYSTIQIYLRDYPTISYGLYCFPNEAQYVENSQSVYYAAMLLSMIPIMLIYGLSQKLVLTNVSVGGLKG